MSKNKPSSFAEHRVAVQVRVSRDFQNNESQEAYLRQTFTRLGMQWPPDRYGVREKESAYKRRNFDRREALRASVEAIERGELSGIMFLNVSRVSRFLKDGERWYERMERARARVIFAERPDIDIFTHAGRDWFIEELTDAERYSLRLSQRVRRGRAWMAEQNVRMPGRQGFGAQRVGESIEWTPDAEIVRRAITMLHAGASTVDVASAISRETGRHFTARTVREWAHAPRYYGLNRHVPMLYGRTHHTAEELRAATLRPATWPGLVPAEWYEPMQADLFARSHQGRGGHTATRDRYPLGRGLMRCAHCGGAVVGETKLGKTGYVCDARHSGVACEAGRRHLLNDDAMAQLGAIVERIRPTPDIIDRAVQVAARHGAMPAKAVDTVKLRTALAHDLAFKRITMAEFKRREREIDRAEADAVQPRTVIDAATLRASMEHMATAWRGGTDADRGDIAHGLFIAVVIDFTAKRIVRLVADDETGPLLAGVSGLRLERGESWVYHVE
jgi:hypothetical protein